jgi:hypothetical protein
MLDEQGCTLVMCKAFWFCTATVVKWTLVYADMSVLFVLGWMVNMGALPNKGALGYLLKAPSTNQKYCVTVPYFSTKCNAKHYDQCPLLLQHRRRFTAPSHRTVACLSKSTWHFSHQIIPLRFRFILPLTNLQSRSMKQLKLLRLQGMLEILVLLLVLWYWNWMPGVLCKRPRA